MQFCDRNSLHLELAQVASTNSEAKELLPSMRPRDTLLISAGSGRGVAAGIPGIALVSGLRDLDPLNKSSPHRGPA